MLNRERHAGLTCWVPADNCVAAVTLAPSGGTDRVEALGCFEALAVALALDERARRRLPEREQAEWAAGVLRRCKHEGEDDWQVEDHGQSIESCSFPLETHNAILIAETLVRGEMLPDGPGGGS